MCIRDSLWRARVCGARARAAAAAAPAAAAASDALRLAAATLEAIDTKSDAVSIGSSGMDATGAAEAEELNNDSIVFQTMLKTLT